ncbi:hypothetical protein QJS10_CPB18g01074 [Acorus calamus]|uniref:RNase H type-1 domain-containing protein n=1 Tax=Acorus calamus TaxID=4465 RepID=A0AAV9CMD4_ACOCL|nr:hypothetical protein QJS10_CPB18g01074 [Acorus calamus]
MEKTIAWTGQDGYFYIIVLDLQPEKLMVGHLGDVSSQSEKFIITDGSTNSITRAAGAAFVICQQHPTRILAAGMAAWPWASPLQMETEAINMGIQVACEMGLPDFEALIRLLQGTGTDPPRIEHLVENIQRCKSKLEDVRWIG